MAFITGFLTKMFETPQELQAFVVTNVTTIYGIVFDNNGKYILFYA